LETRNLDFDNVIILSLNEGMLPVANRQGTYIPNAIRKAYSLPTNEYNDAIYAYLFYRLLQRSETIQFFYNTEPDLIGNGEMSRYLQQVLLESKLPVNKYILHTPVHVQEAQGIVIQKTADVLNQLEKYIVQADGDAPSRLSPSTLNDYIECSLRFYLKNVVRLTEADEVEEDLDARVFGNILHDTIHWFYDEIRQRNNGIVEVTDIDEASAGIDALID
ncbi:MAG: PD-(D/E)XK nuclease family protein, partial [Bacteroidota bacterium]